VISVGEAGNAALGTSVILNSFRQADLTGVDMRQVQLAGNDLSGANLTGANLSGMDLRSCIMRDVRLWDADLRGANLSDIDVADPDTFVQSLFDVTGSAQKRFGEAAVVWPTAVVRPHSATAMIDQSKFL